MHADHATVEVPKLNLPQDLLTEVSRNRITHKTDFRVEGMKKPSLLGRLIEKLVGKHSG